MYLSQNSIAFPNVLCNNGIKPRASSLLVRHPTAALYTYNPPTFIKTKKLTSFSL